VSIFQRINQACGRLARSLGSGEGTEGAGSGFSPGLRHTEAAERREFPDEEFVADEDEERE
jgi:hypothetical protein